MLRDLIYAGIGAMSVLKEKVEAEVKKLGACRSPKVKNCKSDLSELRNIWTDYNFS